MIETLEGVKNAAAIAKVPGVTAIFAASGDLANFTGYRQGQPDYERVINIVHDAAINAGRAAVRPICLARPAGLHVFPGGQRNRGDRPRSGRGVRTTRQHAGQGDRWPTGGQAVATSPIGGGNDGSLLRPPAT